MVNILKQAFSNNVASAIVVVMDGWMGEWATNMWHCMIGAKIVSDK